MKRLDTFEDVVNLRISGEKRLFSATHEEIFAGYTTDVYFLKTLDILRRAGREHVTVTAEIFPRKNGVMAGVREVLNFLEGADVRIWSIEEGEEFSRKEVVMRIEGPYDEFGQWETVILGFLSASSSWATAARECKRAAGERTVLCFGARHTHPAVAPVMERAAIVGGVDGASCILGAKFAGRMPKGTVPHAVALIIGDTVEVARLYDTAVPPEESRIILVDTFKDEAEESLRVAMALGDKLNGIRLDTPEERGGITPELVKEVRYRLDLQGFKDVKIFVSGGINPDKIERLKDAPVDGFGVGSYIVHGTPIDMTMDIKEVEGLPVAKRGRLPGKIENQRLKRVK